GPWMLFGPMRKTLQTIQPNRAHTALAELEARLASEQSFTLITQNIDSLHQRAGSRTVIEYHGTVQRTRKGRSPEATEMPAPVKTTMLWYWVKSMDTMRNGNRKNENLI
ncbi:MAG TPA: Sir2 family NAD-dependent protein deacetylase, partial [Anaerolineaceae bacterium]|nr:Sir2 family NAD-dependent protein deacetylase [Anaerolineaceae bacterium]